MLIEKKVKAVERLFDSLERQIEKYANKNLLVCKQNCSECCENDSIYATPLEFLPYSYYINKLGKLDEQYWAIKAHDPVNCFYLQTKEFGVKHCSIYNNRGLVCRLFGNACRVNKTGTKNLIACKYLNEQMQVIPKAVERVEKHAPSAVDFYSRLRSIDADNGSLQMPINLAIQKSMEIVYNATRRNQRRRV